MKRNDIEQLHDIPEFTVLGESSQELQTGFL